MPTPNMQSQNLIEYIISSFDLPPFIFHFHCHLFAIQTILAAINLLRHSLQSPKMRGDKENGYVISLFEIKNVLQFVNLCSNMVDHYQSK